LHIGLLSQELQESHTGETKVQQVVVTTDQQLDEIIAGCRKNERLAQKALYEKYFGRMMGIARRYIKDNEDALEVVNMGFLKIFNNINQFKGIGSFEGWMSKTIINNSLDFLRANKAYEEQIQLDKNFDVKYDKLPEKTDYSTVDTEKLYLMIDQLPPMTKMVFNLFAIDGYSHKEIGEKLNISTGTTKWHVSSARQKLKELLMLELSNQKITDENK